MNPITKNSNTLFDKLITHKSKIPEVEKNNEINSADKQIVSNIKTNNVLINKANKTNIFKTLTEKQNTDYKYKLNNLDINKNVNYKGKVYLCLYTIVTEAIQPFLLYLLCKEGDKMTMPYFDAKKYNFFDDFEKNIKYITNDNKHTYKGQILFNNELYVFYALDDNLYSVANLNKNDTWWFTLITEICYLKEVLTFKVDNSVITFFMNNPDICKLYDNNDILFMSPHPLYYGSNMEYIENIVVMGAYKNNEDVYFGSYDISVRHGGWSSKFKPLNGNIKSKNSDYISTLLTDNEFGRYKSGGIVRFAVFIGNHKTILNRPYDTQKDWTKNYDSLHKSEMTVDKYSINNQKGYTFITKRFNQHYPLSYHKLDKKSMGPMYELKKIYVIE